MSRIGKKPIALPKGVTFAVDGNTVRVKGPKGEVTNHIPNGVALEQQDGHLLVKRQSRALVNNAV
jgi:large subunit ribosomal protein L6